MQGNQQPGPLQQINAGNVQNILGGIPQAPSLFEVYSTENAQLRLDKANLEQQVETLQTDYNDLQQQYNQIQASNETLQDQVKDLAKKVDLLMLEIKVLRGTPSSSHHDDGGKGCDSGHGSDAK